MSDFLTLVPNYTFQKSDRKGPVVLTSVLKVVESNKSWFERQPGICLYARILFPKIVENKEFLHSYKKDDLLPSIGYRPANLGTERMDL